ncbi:MAG: Ulp1 family isopeptidase [Parachlamydiaceae bacterium]
MTIPSSKDNLTTPPSFNGDLLHIFDDPDEFEGLYSKDMLRGSNSPNKLVARNQQTAATMKTGDAAQKAIERSYVPPGKTLRDWKWVRLASHYLTSIFISSFKTFRTKISNLLSKKGAFKTHSELTLSIRESKKFGTAEEQNFPAGLHELNKKDRIGTSAVLVYAAHLIETDISRRKKLFTAFVQPNDKGRVITEEQLNEIIREMKDKGLTQIAIPVVLTKIVGGDHIVSFFVDKTAKTIDFYDPKGLKVGDCAGTRIRATDTTLRQFLNQLQEKLKEDPTSPDYTVGENTRINQWDNHNCGIHCLDYITKRFEGKSHEEICQAGLSIDQTDEFRKNAIEAILGMVQNRTKMGSTK